MLERFGLTELRKREPHLLSGGQKQRTALAGVLAVPRRVLVLDEPTAMLDPAGRGEVLEAVRGLRAEGLAVVYVTQEMDEVVGADRVVALEAGTVVYAGERGRPVRATATLVRRLGLGLPAAGELALELGGARAVPLTPLPLTLDELLAALGSSTERSTREAPPAERDGVARHGVACTARLQLRGGSRADPGAARRELRAGRRPARWRCSERPAPASRRCCR